LEIGFSWNGLAGPLFDKWKKAQKENASREKKNIDESSSLFPEMQKEEKKKVEMKLERLGIWDDARRIRDMVLGQVAIQQRNPVEIPAKAFRFLLWPKDEKAGTVTPHWKKKIESALTSLNKFTFTIRSHNLSSLKGYGSFVGEWDYVDFGDLGGGSRGDGVYRVLVTPGSLGCLGIYETGKTRLRSGKEAISFDFSKKLTKEEEASLGWKKKNTEGVDHYVLKDAGGVFYATAAGLTPTQENLAAFIDRNETLRGDVSKTKGVKVNWKAQDSREPRIYTSSFCPLLEEGKKYHGALGHHRPSPEAGYTLGGVENRKGRRTGGLIFHMGHSLPAGGGNRASVIDKALQDLHVVVEDYLKGVVAGNDGEGWIPFNEFSTIGEKKLKGLRVFIFLPPNWRSGVRAKWEETTGRRVTEDPKEAERETWEGGSPGDNLGELVANRADGFKGWPRHRRLHGIMKARGLNQKKLASIFGVTAGAMSHWLQGKRSEGESRVRRVLIPERLHPLMDRWIETGKEPTPEELEASKTKGKNTAQ